MKITEDSYIETKGRGIEIVNKLNKLGWGCEDDVLEDLHYFDRANFIKVNVSHGIYDQLEWWDNLPTIGTCVEIKVEDLLNDSESWEPKQGEKVLVRDNNDDDWVRRAFITKYNDDYICEGNTFCSSYDGWSQIKQIKEPRKITAEMICEKFGVTEFVYVGEEQ